MPFYNREREKEELRRILSGEPNFLYFVYGPINSGKTALLMKVIEELPEDYVIFYINFRWRDVQSVDDLIRVLFKVKRGLISEEIGEFIKEILKTGAKALHKLRGIPIPENIFDLLFKRVEKVEDIFGYLEEYFEGIKAEGYQPVFILDEMQTIKEVVNTAGRSVLNGLFNFLIGMTKEKHLCHVLCATSDCLFIDMVYSGARLEGRAKYFLVDDMDKEKAFEVYEAFGFEDKELIWEYIGGKPGDMVSLYEEKKRGYREKEALERMLKDEVTKLEWMLDLIEEGEKQGPKVEEIKKVLDKFKERESREYKEVKGKVLRFLIEQNILFYNPMEGIVRSQSRLIWRALQKVL